MADPFDVIYRARLHPHRSLTRRGARMVIAAVACISLAVSVPFFLLGAWPVIGFFGLDVLALAGAFALSFRSARAYEEVAVTPLELAVDKVGASGARRTWRCNPAWVRLVRRDHEEFGLLRLALVSRGRQIEIGGFLGPDARATVASDLSRALSEARRGPRFQLS